MRMTWKSRLGVAGIAATSALALAAGTANAAGAATAYWTPSTNVLTAKDILQDSHSAVAQISIGGTIRKTVWAPNGVGSTASATVSIPAGYTTGSVRACIGDINVGASSIRNCGSWASVAL